MGSLRKEYIPFGRPKFSNAEIAAATRVLRSAWVGMGAETIAFEGELAAFVEARHVVAVNSCTSALHLSLLVSGIKPGDEVICPSLTWCSTANAALYVGARPVFCDIDPGTLCLTPGSVRARLTRKTRAVMVVHFGGYAVDVEALRAALPKHVVIIEDAAHALGARHPNGAPVGSSGNLVCFSFYPNKSLATADGGAIALMQAAPANRLRSLRQHALPIDAWKRYTHSHSLLMSNELTELGYKMNFNDLQASIARVQLRRQGEFGRHRRDIARYYFQRLSNLRPPLEFQDEVCTGRHAHHLFTIRLPAVRGKPTRDRLLRALRARNIGATIHYTPLHRMQLYGQRRHALPVTDRVCSRIMTLPISASMTLADAEYVADNVIGLFG